MPSHTLGVAEGLWWDAECGADEQTLAVASPQSVQESELLCCQRGQQMQGHLHQQRIVAQT